MASFLSETGFNYRTLDLSDFASDLAVRQFSPVTQSGLPFDIYTQGLYGIDGGTRAALGGDLAFDGNLVSGDAFLFAVQSTDATGHWLYDFQVTDTAINALNVHFMLNSGSPSYARTLFMAMFFGNDTIELSPFDDVFDGSSGDDVMFGQDGNDDLTGGNGNDHIEGGGGRDYLLGGLGRDSIFGGSGADQLIGDRGADNLSGGGGADRFVYGSPRDGRDTIWDFKSVDLLAFKASSFGGLATGALDAKHFVSRAADNQAQDASDHFVYNEASRELWFDSNGSQDGGLYLIARFNGLVQLSADDIVMI